MLPWGLSAILETFLDAKKQDRESMLLTLPPVGKALRLRAALRHRGYPALHARSEGSPGKTGSLEYFL